MKAEAQPGDVRAASFARSIAIWGPGLAGDAGRHRRRQCRDRRPGRRAMGLSSAAARAAADSDALHGSGIDRAARGPHRPRPRRTDPRTVRAPDGRGFRRGAGGGVIGSLITEFTGVAGIGELFGLSRSLTLPLAAAALLVIVASGSYRRVERAALFIGLFELAFFVVAWAAHPGLAALARDAIDLPSATAISCSGRGGHRGDLQPMDDLLPAVRHRRQKAAARRYRPRALGHRRGRGPDPVPDGRGARRRGGHVRPGPASREPVRAWARSAGR